jgi:hypothetical protein
MFLEKNYIPNIFASTSTVDFRSNNRSSVSGFDEVVLSRTLIASLIRYFFKSLFVVSNFR